MYTILRRGKFLANSSLGVKHFMSVKLYFLCYFSDSISSNFFSYVFFCDRVLVTKTLKILFKIGSLPCCYVYWFIP